MRIMKSSSDSKHPSSCIDFVDLKSNGFTLQWNITKTFLLSVKSLSDFKD